MTLITGLLAATIGMGYFIYGKKSGRYCFLISGTALMIYPYFIKNITAVILTGIILLILPFLLNK